MRDVRLPRHLKPELYKLELLPFIIPDNFTIRGHLELTLECVAVSKNVTLHVADMTLSMTTLVEHIGAHYTQYPIIRNGDQRPPVEFLKISKILDSHRFLFYHASLVTVS